MKNYILTTLFVLCIGSVTVAQEFEVPKKGAKIYVETNALEVEEAGQITFDLYLVKSKAAKRVSFDDPRFLAPDGLDFFVKKDEDDPSHYEVILQANQIQSGSYSVTVMGKTSGAHSVTGTILSCNVKSSSVVASKDGE